MSGAGPADEEISPEGVVRSLAQFLASRALRRGAPIASTALLSEQGFDSLSLMEVVLFIERNYELKLPLEQLTSERLHLEALRVRTEDHSRTIAADAVIDCSGDALVSAFAGARMIEGPMRSLSVFEGCRCGKGPRSVRF